jgi:hypothetical protein
MSDTTNGRQAPRPAEPGPEGRARLLAALDLERARHPVDAATLGEYVELLDGEGLAAARAAFPEVAAHLAGGCAACHAEVEELRALTDDDEADGARSPGPVRPAPPAPPARLLGGAAMDGRAGGAAVHARVEAPPAPLDPVLRRRRRMVVLQGLTAVAAIAVVIMGAALATILAIPTTSGTGQTTLVDREPSAPAPPPAPTVAGAQDPGRGSAPPAPATPTSGAPPGGGASASPVGMDCPAGQPIKANRQSGIYHVPGGAFYGATRPEACFATPEDAERAGFRRSQR